MEDKFKKYIGECVAMIDDKVIASGRTRIEAYKKAKNSYPTKTITLMYVPTKKETLTFL
ncbi:MAG: DUF5678 domain-containing protein [Nanoarchaeota archaeon]